MPDIMSEMEAPTRTGSRSAKPVTDIRPDMPWITVSSARLGESGPVWPKPEMEAMTMEGHLAWTESQS